MDDLWIIYVSGWWYTYPSEKYESIGMMTFPIYGKIKNVPNHQPDIKFVVSVISHCIHLTFFVGFPKQLISC